jgi:hypothetical protein
LNDKHFPISISVNGAWFTHDHFLDNQLFFLVVMLNFWNWTIMIEVGRWNRHISFIIIGRMAEKKLLCTFSLHSAHIHRVNHAHGARVYVQIYSGSRRSCQESTTDCSTVSNVTRQDKARQGSNMDHRANRYSTTSLTTTHIFARMKEMWEQTSYKEWVGGEWWVGMLGGGEGGVDVADVAWRPMSSVIHHCTCCRRHCRWGGTHLPLPDTLRLANPTTFPAALHKHLYHRCKTAGCGACWWHMVT